MQNDRAESKNDTNIDNFEYLKIKNIYDNVPILISLLDSERKVIYANYEFKKFTGLDDEKIRGKAACGLLGCANSFNDHGGCGFGKNCAECSLLAAISDSLQNSRPHKDIEYNPTLIFNGCKREFSFIGTTTPLKTESGGGVLLCLTDITMIKNITRDALESRNKFELIFKMSPDALVISRVDNGLIVNANDGFYELSGFTPDEVKDKTSSELNIWFDLLDRQKVVDELFEKGYCTDFEYTFRKKDGQAIACLTSIRIINLGGIKHLLSVTRDISTRKKTEKALLEAKKSAEDASAAKSQFLANMSHEIRTPLNSIIGHADLLLDTNVSGEPKEFIENIDFSARSLLSIINDILDLSKIEAGKLELDETKTDIIKLLKQTIGIFKFNARRKSLNLLLNIDPRMPQYMTADSTRLKQVLANLISNAIKFTEKGEVELNAVFTPEGDMNRASFKFLVRDTGIGIDETERALLFKAFSQADPSITRRFGGTGLGLIISNTLIKKMGGAIEFISQKGHGSNFYFSLTKNFEYESSSPEKVSEVKTGEVFTCAGDANREEKSAESLCESFAAFDKNAKDNENKIHIEKAYEPVIMLVEDSPMNMKLFVSIFKKLVPGANIMQAEDGAKAIELFNKQRPDIVFMDIQMPVMDGYEATRQMRYIEKSGMCEKNVKIVALTASAIKGEKERCEAAGVDCFMTKPLDYKAIKAILDKYLSRDA